MGSPSPTSPHESGHAVARLIHSLSTSSFKAVHPLLASRILHSEHAKGHPYHALSDAPHPALHTRYRLCSSGQNGSCGLQNSAVQEISLHKNLDTRLK